ncbi:MAG: hypothetical protein DCC72_11270 [Burkholderiales bacterium]|nr:MAG: hypothetical protein DCC72_11270 [Burkholderiales bacterium]
MTESEARNALLLRAFELAPAGVVRWTDDDRAWASRAAAEVEGASAAGERFVARRAQLALERLGTREAIVRRAQRGTDWRPWLGWALPAIALAAGLATDAIGPSRHVNVLAPPLLAVMAWNLVVYLSLAVHALLRRSGHPQRGAIARAIARVAQRAIVPGRDNRAADDAGDAGGRRRARGAVIGRFAADWAKASAGLTAVRVARVLHVSAIAFALGALAGLYVRGLVFEYRAGWESTFLDANALHAVLGFVLKPASLLTGIPLPDVARLEAMRFPETGGERAAPWIHLYALMVALVVVVPRTLLALYDRVLEHRLARSFPLPAADRYFASLLREHSGEAALVLVLPCHFAPSPQSTLTLRAVLGAVFGPTLKLVVAPATDYGDEESVDGAFASTPDAAVVLALFSASATPEAETHGVFLARMLARRPAGSELLALVDESAFASRFGGSDPVSLRRRDERRQAWKRLLAAHECRPVFVDLERDDATEAGRRVREALDRRIAQPVSA